MVYTNVDHDWEGDYRGGYDTTIYYPPINMTWQFPMSFPRGVGGLGYIAGLLQCIPAGQDRTRSPNGWELQAFHIFSYLFIFFFLRSLRLSSFYLNNFEQLWCEHLLHTIQVPENTKPWNHPGPQRQWGPLARMLNDGRVGPWSEVSPKLKTSETKKYGICRGFPKWDGDPPLSSWFCWIQHVLAISGWCRVQWGGIEEPGSYDSDEPLGHSSGHVGWPSNKIRPCRRFSSEFSTTRNIGSQHPKNHHFHHLSSVFFIFPNKKTTGASRGFLGMSGFLFQIDITLISRSDRIPKTGQVFILTKCDVAIPKSLAKVATLVLEDIKGIPRSSDSVTTWWPLGSRWTKWGFVKDHLAGCETKRHMNTRCFLWMSSVFIDSERVTTGWFWILTDKYTISAHWNRFQASF